MGAGRAARMTRRAWIVGGVAVAAALAGAGGQLWQAQRSRQRAERFDAETGGLWAMRFAQPGGGELVMASLLGRPLLLNFWATWCPPCVKEMPEIDRFHRSHGPRGITVVGLAVDGPTPVREFLGRTPVGYSIGLAGLEGTELSRRLGNDRGALPFTALFGADGRPLRRKLGETHYDELVAWAGAV